MTTSQQVLALARSQLGTLEARDGSTPYHRAYGLGFSQPWCAVFLWDVFRRAGGADLLHPKTAYTPTLAQWFRDRHRWTAGTPTVGALVFYNWPDSLDRIQHVGLVEAFDAVSITAIEGNTSSGVAGSQSNGGGVWRRRRARNASIVGYGHPMYTTAVMSEEDDLTPEQDTLLREVHRELTMRLPNRRGPDGRNLPNGGADTTLGYSANADGMLFHLMARVDELLALVRAAGADPAAIEHAVAAALAGGLTVTSTIAPRA